MWNVGDRTATAEKITGSEFKSWQKSVIMELMKNKKRVNGKKASFYSCCLMWHVFLADGEQSSSTSVGVLPDHQQPEHSAETKLYFIAVLCIPLRNASVFLHVNYHILMTICLNVFVNDTSGTVSVCQRKLFLLLQSNNCKKDLELFSESFKSFPTCPLFCIISIWVGQFS